MVFDSIDILVPHFITPRHVQLGLLVSHDVEIVILVHIPDTLLSTGSKDLDKIVIQVHACS